MLQHAVTMTRPHVVGPTDHSPYIFTRLARPHPTVVFDSFWSFATERQNIFHLRLQGAPPPWTCDSILAEYRFTNAYRASDRVSQFLIRHVIYAGDQDPTEIFFRTILFKLFNRIATWELITSTLGWPQASDFSVLTYEKALSSAFDRGQRLYSPAYIMPPAPTFGARRKHHNHLLLLERLLVDRVADRLAEARSMEAAYNILKRYPSLGPFLAYQFIIDLNYGPLLRFSEMDFVVPGPGARGGLRKCFSSFGDFTECDLIRLVAETQSDEFSLHALHFRSLWGRPLQLVDCQNLFCETDKYARVAHPDHKGLTARHRIKQRYSPGLGPDLPLPWYPPKWHINDRIPHPLKRHAPAGA